MQFRIPRVSVNWLFESESYNEWMWEDDFEVDEAGDPVNNEEFISEDDYAECFEKRVKKKGKLISSHTPSLAKPAHTMCAPCQPFQNYSSFEINLRRSFKHARVKSKTIGCFLFLGAIQKGRPT